MQGEIPQGAAAIAFQVDPTKHYEAFFVFFWVASDLGYDMRPARAGHFSENCKRLPSFIVDVENTNVV